MNTSTYAARDHAHARSITFTTCRKQTAAAHRQDAQRDGDELLTLGRIDAQELVALHGTCGRRLLCQPRDGAEDVKGVQHALARLRCLCDITHEPFWWW